MNIRYCHIIYQGAEKRTKGGRRSAMKLLVTKGQGRSKKIRKIANKTHV